MRSHFNAKFAVRKLPKIDTFKLITSLLENSLEMKTNADCLGPWWHLKFSESLLALTRVGLLHDCKFDCSSSSGNFEY